MDESWLSTSQAAERLGISPAHARRLIQQGELSALQRERVWFVDPAAVVRRQRRAFRSGRAVGAAIAWRLLHALDLPPGTGDDQVWTGLSAVQRHRLRVLMADLPDAPELVTLMRNRARRILLHAHPGVLDRLAADPKVSPGAGRAAAAHGAGLARGGRDLLYMPEDQVEGMIAEYHLRTHPAGNVEVAAVPACVPEHLHPLAGQPVRMSVAWLDLMEDPDPRAAGLARDWLATQRARFTVSR